MRLEHPIFQGPLAAGVELDPTNEWEKEYDPRGTWLVHSGEFPEVDVGVVSDGLGFEDSPDCERISGGVNSKGPEAVAIGRQANMLQWGFYGAPDRMTQSAKRVFLNAIVYMQRFDGAQPLIGKQARSRGWMKKTIRLIGALETMEAEARARFEEYLRGALPAEAIDEHGLDEEALLAWYAANVEYLTSKDRFAIGVDEELRALELSNRSPAFLEWIAERLAADAFDGAALTLAWRYLDVDEPANAAAILTWLEEHRPRLFFSDTGGYRWFVDTRQQPAGAAR